MAVDRDADRQATKWARTHFTKRGIELGRCDFRVTHGVLYLRGVVTTNGAVDFSDLRTEIANIARVLRQKPEIKDVVIECQYV